MTRRRKDRAITSSGCVAQAWRDGSRRALLARLLAGTTEHALGSGRSRQVGELCGTTGTSDVIDAHVVTLAQDQDTVLTSDPDDIATLLRAAGCSARTIHC